MRDDDGRVLDAEYQVENDGPCLALIMQSRSGRHGSQPPVNPDYNDALTVLLGRLGRLSAVITDAVVDSRATRTERVPEAARRIISGPVDLSREPDMAALRRRLGTAQAKVAQTDGATRSGNATRRIRLRLDVPGYSASQDAGLLAADLAAPLPPAPATFVLAWHPGHYAWQDRGYPDAIQATAAGQAWREDWTVGVRTGGISPGDRAVLYRQHHDRGLVAAGTFTSAVQMRPHWDGSGRLAPTCDIDWDTVLDVPDRLPAGTLQARIAEVPWGHLQGSGVAVPPAAARRLGSLWQQHVRLVRLRQAAQAAGLVGPAGPLDARDLLAALTGVRLSTVTGRPNTVLRVHADSADVATAQSPEGEPVPIAWVQAGLDQLARAGEVEVSPAGLGHHRSSFTAAVLLALPGTQLIRSRPARIRIAAAAGPAPGPAARPAGPPLLPAGSPGLGQDYRPAGPVPPGAGRQPVTVDPDIVARGLAGHAGTQDDLAAALRRAGFTPRSPLPYEPPYDLAWEHDGTIFVAEVKSITAGNEEHQLRLGLGQILRYRHRLQQLGHARVVAVLVPEHPPRDSSWPGLCQQLGVVLLDRSRLGDAATLPGLAADFAVTDARAGQAREPA